MTATGLTAATRSAVGAVEDHGRGGGVALAVGVVAVAAVGSSVGLGGVLHLGFPLLAAAVAAVLVLARRWAAYVEFALLVTFTAPLVRRLVDLDTGFTEVSPILGTPFAVAVVAVPVVLAGRGRAHADVRLAFGVALTAAAYAFAVGAVRTGVVPAATGLIDELGPILLGATVLAVPGAADRLDRAVVRVAAFGTTVLGVYGLLQWLYAPPWDGLWVGTLYETGVATSFGQPEPMAIRVFSTMESPGVYALAAVALLVLLLPTVGSRWRLIGWVATPLALAIGGVRTAWLAAAAALIGFCWAAGRRVPKVLALAPLALVAVLVIQPPGSELVAERAGTLVGLGDDVSAAARVALYTELAYPAVQDPIGAGFGTTGTAARVAGPEQRDIDSGFITVLITYGSVLGAALLLALTNVTVQSARRVHGTFDLRTSAFAVTLMVPVALLFGEVLTGAIGAVVWVAYGLLGRAGVLLDAPVVDRGRPMSSS